MHVEKRAINKSSLICEIKNNNMKTFKIVLSLALVTIALQSYTQKTEPISFRIRGGVNLQNINGRDPLDAKLENKLKTGFHIGASADVPIATDFAVQGGVLFSTKGAKLKGTDDKLNIGYIEIPVLFIHTPKLGRDRLILGVGPYVAFGVGGKLNRKNGSDEDITFKKEINFSDVLNADKEFLKRFDAGANLLAGYELGNGVFVQLNAQLGLVKINPKIESVSNDKTSLKNTGFGLSVGYHLGGGR
jgi:hypothetical protein